MRRFPFDQLLFLSLLATSILAATHASAPEQTRAGTASGNLATPNAWLAVSNLLDSLGVQSACLVIDVDQCRFQLFDARRQLLRQGFCATGMDSTLRATDGRTWRFATPRGVRRIHHKSSNPVWEKPDWYYIEEGQEIPADDAPERLTRGMLGEYALDVGQGYLVHGSPYQRGFGEQITHGCVRLPEDDLRAVYNTLDIGDAVVLR